MKGGLIAIPIPIDIMINEDTLPETLHTYASVHGITFGMTTTIESPEKGTKIQINAGNLNCAHTKAHRNKTIRKKYAAKVILTVLFYAKIFLRLRRELLLAFTALISMIMISITPQLRKFSPAQQGSDKLAS